MWCRTETVYYVISGMGYTHAQVCWTGKENLGVRTEFKPYGSISTATHTSWLELNAINSHLFPWIASVLQRIVLVHIHAKTLSAQAQVGIIQAMVVKKSAAIWK